MTSPRLSDEININGSEMVFAGFGIIAPEYNWNDYRGLDVKGKRLLCLLMIPDSILGKQYIFQREGNDLLWQVDL